MKKGMLLTAVAVAALLVSGCGEEKKTLNCTMKEELGGATTSSEMKVVFKGDKAETIDMSITIDYTDEYASFGDVFKQTLESQKTSFESLGYEVKISSGDNQQKLTARGTSETLDESESTGTYEDTKKELEASGFTCK